MRTKNRFPKTSMLYIELFETLTTFGGLNNKKSISLISKLYGLKESYVIYIIRNRKSVRTEKEGIKLIKK